MTPPFHDPEPTRPRPPDEPLRRRIFDAEGDLIQIQCLIGLIHCVIDAFDMPVHQSNALSGIAWAMAESYDKVYGRIYGPLGGGAAP